MEHRTASRTAASCALLAVATFTALAFSPLLHHAVPVWSPAALTLAWMLCSPHRRAPALLLASMAGASAVNLFRPEMAFTAAATTAAIQAIEAGGVYYLVRRLLPGGLDVGDPRSLAVFAGAAAGGAALASLATTASFGAAALANLPQFARWGVADLLGMTILPPCILILRRSGELLRARPIKARGVCLFLAAAAFSVVIFFQERLPLMFLVPPLILLASLELELLGAAIATVFVIVVATIAAVTGHGPTQLMAVPDFERGLVQQSFLLLVAGTSLGGAAFASRSRALVESLARSHQAARTAAEHAAFAESVAGVGHWRVDAVTTELTWSAGMYAIFGLDPSRPPRLPEVLGMLHAEDREVLAAAVAAGLRGEMPELPESRPPERLVRSDGQVRYVTGRIVTERDANGAPAAAFGTLLDVTEQHLAQMAVAESEARFRMLAENISDVIVRADRHGRPLYASPSIQQVLGVTPTEAVRKGQPDTTHPDDVADFLRTFGDICAGKLPAGTRIRHRRRHGAGHYVWVESAPTPLFDDKGALIEVLDVVRDVTRQKVLEDELEAARREAEAAAEVKAQFLANMSHELRTPLTAVLGFSSLIERQPELSEATRGYLARLSTAGAALHAVINDVLDFTRLEAGGVELKLGPTDPTEVIRRTAATFALAAEAKGLTLEVSGVEALPAQVEIDDDHVRQVLMNLIGNAVKFTDAGTVAIEARYGGSGMLTVSVADSGAGISRRDQARLFKRFSQVDGSSTRRHGGSGLGLAICKGLVEAMGGEIGVRSRAGVGSTFWFKIPAPVVEAAQPAPDLPVEIPPPGLRVLVVDDHPVNRQLVQAVLAPLEVELFEASGGREAVQMARKQAFDVILMDLRMPGFDGLSALRAIRDGEGPNRSTVILAFSAEGGEHAAEHRQAGFDGHVAKPTTAESLMTAVARAVRLSPPDRAAARHEKGRPGRPSRPERPVRRSV